MSSEEGSTKGKGIRENAGNARRKGQPAEASLEGERHTQAHVRE